jgi:hypothetical protein
MALIGMIETLNDIPAVPWSLLVAWAIVPAMCVP